MTDQPLPDLPIAGVLVQYPGASGRLRDLGPIGAAAHAAGAGVAVAADLSGSGGHRIRAGQGRDAAGAGDQQG